MFRIITIILICFFNVLKSQVTSDTTKNLNELIDNFILPTDTVADIGSGDMFRVTSLIINNPNTFFYIQDIDSTICNYKKFKWVVSKYKSVVDMKRINFVVGELNDTKLKKQSCTKILLTYMLHEVESKKKLLENLKTKLKPNGELLISETITTIPKKISRGCKRRFMTYEEFYELLKNLNIVIIEEVNYKTIKVGKLILVRCKFG